MSVYLDASALVALHIDGAGRAVVRDVLATDPDWYASGLALTEALALIDRVTDEPTMRADLEDLVRLTWDRVAVVPVDQRCLDAASRMMRDQPLRLSDAVHLAAAERLPRPLQFVTFDAAQIPVAMSMGFDIIST